MNGDHLCGNDGCYHLNYNQQQCYECQGYEEPQRPKSVYVLKLEDSKYYVGASKRPEERIRKHQMGNGPAWTQDYYPFDVITVSEPVHCYRLLERNMTLEYMRKKGWENVRGSKWTDIHIQRPTVL